MARRNASLAEMAQLREQIDVLTADKAIREVIARNGYLWDAVRYQDFVDQFTDDCVLIRGSDDQDPESHRWHGKSGIETIVTEARGGEKEGNLLHMQGLNLVTRSDGDEAEANSYCMTFARNRRAEATYDIVVPHVGNLRWTLKRVEGNWLIREREVTRFRSDAFPECLKPSSI